MSDKASAYAAFVAAQKEFAPALKSSSNPHFKSKYADLAACVEAVLDALNNHGLAVMQRPARCESGVVVRTLFIHVSGEEIDGGELHVPASKQDPQGYGSALTYCRRYGLMAACGIAPEDDDGNAATAATRAAGKPAPKAAPKPELPPVTPEMIATHISAMEATTTLATLQEAFAAAWRITQGAPAVKKAYDKFKTILEATQ